MRVRSAYAEASEETGVEWSGRAYKSSNWKSADPINRSLSCANSCLYGVCHAAIISAGFSPALGFIHTGKMLSFVYDVADLYKTEVSIPVAFREVAEGADKLETRVRRACRDQFKSTRLLHRIVPDLDLIMSVGADEEEETDADFDSDEAAPGGLWDPDLGEVAGGVDWAPNG